MELFTEFFKILIQMSVSASIVTLIVLLCRALLKSAPRKLTYALWLIVAIRLIVPVMLPSDFSLFNVFYSHEASNDNITSSDATDGHISDNDTIPDAGIDENISSDIPSDTAGHNIVDNTDLPTNSLNNSFFVTVFDYSLELPTISVLIWLTGILIFVVYYVISHMKYTKLLQYATLIPDISNNTNVFHCENISTPFVFGTIKPKIYIPYGIEGENLTLILKHERYHICKHDHLTKLFAFFLLVLYWFCPFVWIAFFCFQNDMELRCDEAILNGHDLEIRKKYSNTLLAFANNNRKYLLSPVAFCENSTKYRIKHSLMARKQTIFTSCFTIILVLIISITCLTDRPMAKSNDKTDTISANNKALSEHTFNYGVYHCTFTQNDMSLGVKSIDITKEYVRLFYPIENSLGRTHRYSTEANIIKVMNGGYVAYEIEVIDNTHLKIDGDIYTYELDKSTVAQGYIDQLTDEDISTAYEFINEYLSKQKQYKEFKDIRIVSDHEPYIREINRYYTNSGWPAKMIVIRCTTVGAIESIEQIHNMLLTKETLDSDWLYSSSQTLTTY